MTYREYKQVEQRKTVNSDGEPLVDIINREAKEGEWVVHTIDFSFGRALLTRLVFTDEGCCANGECTCQ